MSLWQFFLSQKSEIAEQTVEHIGLTVISLAIAIAIGVTIGIILTRYPRLAERVIGAVGIIQTIPSVALLGFLLPLLGIGVTPAIVALFLYALLPIVRNTYAGIEEVDSSIKEAARGMGMPDLQILFKVELPLAIAVIFAGIRTAAVTTVGVATLCALIASGGLGEFIFRGIALNNVNMMLAGAIPAAALALLLDFLLGVVQRNVIRSLKPMAIAATFLLALAVSWLIVPQFLNNSFQAGFTAEFMERADGYPGLKEHYDLSLDTVELDPGLMYEAVKDGRVDLISGFATDGRVKAFDLTVLEDDRSYFPPYYAAPVVRRETLRQYPQLQEALAKLAGQISNREMARLNYQVDSLNRPTLQVAKEFLQQLGLKTQTTRQGASDIIIGSKNFTEQYLLADMMAVVIENYTNLDVELKTGLAGTKIAFDALVTGAIDIYPEYTGTGLLVILQADESIRDAIIRKPNEVFDYVRQQYQQGYDLELLAPFGFNNTYALMMRSEDAAEMEIETISQLKNYLETN
ncbi:glycine betaine ABC transporter substrate-binding protein [Myxosarcina sp. GI1(2024)]